MTCSRTNKHGLTLAVLCLGFSGLCNAVAAAPVTLEMKEQPLSAALREFARQTGIQIAIQSELTEGKTAPRLAGKYEPGAALAALLQGTGLVAYPVNENTYGIRAADSKPSAAVTATQTGATAFRVEPELRVAQSETVAMQKVENQNSPEETKASSSESASSEADEANTKGTPEILVKGRRSLNTDIERTEDAPQPYVVFGKEEIQRSQTVNLEEFLRTRLPMNTASGSNGQNFTGNANPTSSINLRGLGSNQTLILVDGRRMPRLTVGTDQLIQSDLNGIPLGAIERIEVLPSTAGGIYGGSATGGVINIILRRDFQGLEAKVTYANTFDTDAANIRLDVSGGFSLEDGRTQVMIAATRSEANNLVLGDRDFAARAIALQLANNPDAILRSGGVPLGRTVNIATPGEFDLDRYFSTGEFAYLPGPNLTLKPVYGGADLGASNTHIPVGYAGPASDNGAALVANAGRFNLAMPGGVAGLERGLLAAPSMDSVALNARREFGPRLEAFLDVSRLGNRGSSFTANVPTYVESLPANAPNNPFQQAINVSFPTPGLSFQARSESTTLRAAGGLIAHLPRNWTGEVDYSWSRSRSQRINTGSIVDSVGSCVLARGVAANVDPDGAGPLAPCATNDSRPALNALLEGNTFPIDFTPYLLPSPNIFSGPYDTILKNATLRFSGPVMNLPGGPLSLSAFIERREEGLQDALYQDINTTTRAPTYLFLPHCSQDADSYYLEARAPLISLGNALPLVRELELQASVRRDEYRTRSTPNSAIVRVPSRDGPFPALNYSTGRLDSTDYTLGLRYAPLEDLVLRASFGTGFLPPSVLQTAPSQEVLNQSIVLDPRRGNTGNYVGVPFTFIYYGGTPNLKPELSESWSAGVILTPRFAPDFRLSIDYTRIEKVDEIQTPVVQFLLDNEDAFPGRIVRGANLAGDPPGWAGPITLIDASFINIAKTSVQAYDIQADYTLETGRSGRFQWYAIATWQPHYRNQLLPAAPVVDSVGFTDGPLEWRGNLGLNWDQGPLTLSWNAQYYAAYRAYTATAATASIASVILNQGSAKIPRQMYHDLIATYRFDATALFAGGLLANSEISLGIQNLFDKSPPILASTDPGSVGYSTYGDPRLRRYSISFRRNFGLK